MLRHPCILGGPQQRGQNQKSKPTPRVHHDAPRNEAWIQRLSCFLNSTGRLGPKRGQKCYVTPAFSGVPNKGDKIRSQNLRQGSPRCSTQQSVDSKIVPVSSIAPEGWGPKEGRNATPPLHSPGSPTKGTKSEVKTYAKGRHDAPRNKAWVQRLSRFPKQHRKVGAQKRAEMLRDPCILGGPQQRGQNFRAPSAPPYVWPIAIDPW